MIAARKQKKAEEAIPPRDILYDMVEIIPAILPKSRAELEEHLARIRGIAKDVQIDVVDGQFAPNLTWPHSEGAKPEDARELFAGFDVEVDLMVNESRAASAAWAALARRIVIHIESPDDKGALLALQERRGADLILGVALNVATPLESLNNVEGLFDFVQLMGIPHPGFQGEWQDSHTTERIATLRRMRPSVTMSIDGGVNSENVRLLAQAGANRLVVGSALFNQSDIRAAYAELVRIANS